MSKADTLNHPYTNIRTDSVIQDENFAIRNIESLLPSDLGDEKGRRMNALINKKRAIQDEKILEEERIVEEKHGSSDVLKKFTTGILIQLSSSIFQSLLSLFACVVFVVNTYYEDDKDTENSFLILEIIIALLFTIDYLIGLSSALNKKKYLTNSLNILDLLTIMPVFISLIDTKKSKFGFARLLRVVRAVRILRLYRLFTVTDI